MEGERLLKVVLAAQADGEWLSLSVMRACLPESVRVG